MPAGLVDAGEGAAASAVRELKEETGYVGVAAEISPVMFNGMFSTTSPSTQNGAGGHQWNAKIF